MHIAFVIVIQCSEHTSCDVNTIRFLWEERDAIFLTMEDMMVTTVDNRTNPMPRILPMAQFIV